MHPSIRVLIADDHQIVRAGLIQFLSDQHDIEVAGEAADGDELLALIRRESFDVILLDIAMPGKNGIDCLRVIRQSNPDLRVLMLSGYPEAHYAINLLRSGASGFVSKNAPSEELIRAIRVVSRGRRYLSEAAADLVSAELSNPTEKKLHETLSEREFQIFRKLATGPAPTEIANDLNLSVKTVSTYRSRVLEKMSLKTNADLTYYAIKNALLD